MNDPIHRVVITGASSGIGLDMARAFLARGSRLVINGRDPEKLERVSRSLDPSQVVAVPGEIGDPATGPALAAELARHKIRVNTLAPGIIRTPLIPDADSLAAIHPLGRVGEVRDTSEAALYLATAGFVTGTTLAVDGGYSHGR